MRNKPTTTVTVYTKTNCRQCVATKRWLTQRDIEFAEVDLLANEKDLEAAKSLGYQEAPIIIVGRGTPGDEVHWSGFNPNKLTEHLSTTNIEKSN
ncbi:NrdH-redoxin [Cryobacterium sp. Hh7]|uniref:glutaredoxin domain-containing protein n=1 Tax=Cryobacterium sp. Hh7 TaxID=1259159 RepID=UPI00106A3FFF|nr:glutaredoxin domain-containing protein [Cryobacterium sp. Hh7]TFD61113.1 NrdH-redoxin [Cryobacterium sp. Hh7]